MHNSVSNFGLEAALKSEGKRISFALTHLWEFEFILEETASLDWGHPCLVILSSMPVQKHVKRTALGEACNPSPITEIFSKSISF